MTWSRWFPSRRLVAGASILATTWTGLAASAAAAASATDPTVASTCARGGGGAVALAGSAITGLDLSYDMSGSRIHQHIPAAGWSPRTATDAELQSYGLPARPADAAGLRDWQDMFAHYRGAGSPGLCEGRRTHALVRTQKDGNWAGGVLIPSSPGRNEYSSAKLGWYQAGFHPQACGSTAAYSTWVGLGGFSSKSPGYSQIGGPSTGGLIQAGTDYYQPANEEYAWWEAISTTHPFPEVIFTNSWLHIHPGDQMYAWVSYTNGTAGFTVYDASTGYLWTASMSSYNNVLMSAFYDGTTADFISEAPTGSSGVLPLAEPWTGNTYFDHATANGLTIMNYSSWAEVQATTSYNIDTTSWNGVRTWFNYWQRCH